MPDTEDSMRTARCLMAVALLFITPLVVAKSAAAAGSACRPITFVGIHGLGEGPQYSETIYQTQLAYGEWAVKHGHATSTTFMTVDYPVEDGAKFVEGQGLLIDTAVNALDTTVSKARRDCPSTYFVLSGYSLGAWAIDKFMADRAGSTAKLVLAIMLYGDPWWYDVARGDRGLARIWHNTDDPYPQYPAITRTLCAGHDPICGAEFGSKLGPQLFAVAVGGANSGCGTGGLRPHVCYLADAAKQGGVFLAERALSWG